ncbi:hypothetical protein AB0H43_04355 [Hamadaea sp. NPDC050747]|uniref:hypothetical protein n=1 Tax=Hamadaea sp. NPDC050747 TaxID=3155789 RepID=UPI0033E8DC81
MRIGRVLTPVLLAAVLALSACGAGSAGDGTGEGTELGDLTSANTETPGCPFTAKQVSEIIGQPMTDQGTCSFGDGKGVAGLTVTTASELAGGMTFDYQRDQAGKTYAKVVDLDHGDRGYLAVKDIQAEAVVVSSKGSYTLIMSSFSFDEAKYDSVLRKLLDVVFG